MQPAFANNISDLLQKRLSRREFLLLVGSFLLFTIGVTGLINRISQFGISSNSFGGSSYGGKEISS